MRAAFSLVWVASRLFCVALPPPKSTTLAKSHTQRADKILISEPGYKRRAEPVTHMARPARSGKIRCAIRMAVSNNCRAMSPPKCCRATHLSCAPPPATVGSEPETGPPITRFNKTKPMADTLPEYVSAMYDQATTQPKTGSESADDPIRFQPIGRPVVNPSTLPTIARLSIPKWR